MLPFFLRHYEKFCTQINVWDDQSDDGSREILAAHPLVRLHDWEFDDGISEDRFLEFAYNKYPTACGHADWVIWPDLDEFIYHPHPLECLKQLDESGYRVCTTEGFNMCHDGLPKDDGRQIWEIARLGVHATVYSKPVIFKPTEIIRWNRGKHALESKHRLPPSPPFKLLHYRYLGREYTTMKNAKNYARCGLKSGDKGAAWTCAPDYHGEHSADWAEQIMSFAKEVV